MQFTVAPPSEDTMRRVARREAAQWPLRARLRRMLDIWTPQRLWRPCQLLQTRRGKALMAFGHCTLQGVAGYSRQWQSWHLTHPGHPSLDEPPFDPKFSARAALVSTPLFTRHQTAALADAWDAAKDSLTCAPCWQNSAARQLLDYAVADAMGYSRSSMDTAAAQVAAVANRLRALEGDPPIAECEIPDACPGPGGTALLTAAPMAC